MKVFVALSIGALCLGLAGCGEKPQAAGKRQGGQEPYTTAVGPFSSEGWKQGDATSWGQHMTTRTQRGQNEYGRTGPH